MAEDRVYIVGGEDENGDQHLFATDDLGRAIAKYNELKGRLRKVQTNEGLADAMDAAANPH
ncbi:hypothetical protein [Sphingomonas sp. OTU376]|uniref:hypothetical protein n=1 Tax=Sphingomonas sp. OTU376 TaxID=3043863 RepID=UPI00313CF23E